MRMLAVEGPWLKPRIRKFAIEPLTGEPNQETLHRLVAGLRPARATVLSAIPRDQVITRLLKLPSTNPDEVAQMVELSGKAQLPYPPDQAVSDFQMLEEHGGTSQVQLVACHRELIERHLALVRQEGVEPAWIVPSTWGCLAWYQRLGRASQLAEPVMLIHVDADHTDLVFIQHGRVLFSRALAQGLHEWQAGTDEPEPLAQEFERSLSSVLKEFPGMTVNSIVLTGLGELDRWKGFFEQRFDKPVIVKEAHGDLRFPEPPTSQAASPVVVLGLAMAEDQWLVNLLPREVRHAQRHRRRMRELAFTGMLLLASLLLGMGLLAARISRQAQFTGHAAAALKELEAVTEQVERKDRDIKLIEQCLASRRATADMLAELFRLTSPEVLFESVVFERARGELVVRGSALMTRQVLDYVHSLEQSDQWERVELRYSARRSVAGQMRTDFEIVLYHRITEEPQNHRGKPSA